MVFCDVSVLFEDVEFTGKLNPDHLSLLQALIFSAERSQNVHDVVKRIDKAAKIRAFSVSQTMVIPADIQNYIQCLSHCYFTTADTTRIPRAIEKLWKPYESEYKEWIEECLGCILLHTIQSDKPQPEDVSKVSVLLEQSRYIQRQVQKYVSPVCGWIDRQMIPLLQLTPDKLSRNQSNCLYELIKICLQLFQECPSELGAVLFPNQKGQTDDTESVLFTQTVHRMIKHLIHVLSTQGYGVDCILLSGTAAAMSLKTAKTTQVIEQGFYNLLLHISTNEQVFTLDLLQQTLTSVELKQKLSDIATWNINMVALIRGIVACGDTDLFFLRSDQETHVDNFIWTLFDLLETVCQSDITLYYHGFQTLHLWYTKLTKATSKLKSCESQLTCVYRRTVQLVLLNWDSPIEDVPETVVEIFTCMMGVWTEYPSTEETLPQQVLTKLLQVSWFIKGKYRILSALLKFVDAQKVLEEFPVMKKHLLQCLTTNHLTSSATNVYKAFLKHIQKTSGGTANMIDVWRSNWLPTVLDGLTNSDSFLRHNVCLHWVPATFQILPSSTTCLQGHLSDLLLGNTSGIDHVRLLKAWVVVTRTIRMLTGVVNLSEGPVHEALYCADEDVREEAIGLVCSSLKKAETQSELEVILLKEVIPHNIKIDSPPFRQLLGSNIRKLLVRVRDSCISMLKDPVSNNEALGRGLDFVDWLHDVCIDCLYPGASYQRLKGSLDLLHVVYETFIYVPDSQQRKGVAPKGASDLMVYARSQEKWKFFSNTNCSCLILCILDGADEIQMSASQLLTRFYTLPQGEETGEQETSLPCHLLSESLRLCNSPKGHESQSGATLLRLVFYKYIVCQNLRMTFDISSSGGYIVTEDRTQQGPIVVVEFLQQLLAEVQRCMTEADRNPVEASKTWPIHGLVAAITKCLTETKELWSNPQPELSTLVENLVNACQTIIHKMLGIMALESGKDVCPSFAEIGMALENLVQESQTDYSDSTSNSSEFQYMLSWCWNNIKESCVCLGEMSWTTLITANHGTQTLKPDMFQRISETFVNVLTNCRHKGVIEGSRTAFIRFCSALFQGEEESLQGLPDSILTKVLSSLRGNTLKTSVTRRSAGLPVIILAMLVSEKVMKKNTFLMKSVKDLFETSSLPFSGDSEGLHDLPQVHSLNILYALFCDAKLASSLMGYVSKTVILVIQQFGSASWAIRSAATKLFSTLITRLFGQKKGGEEVTRNSVSFVEFMSHYPELPPFLLEILQEAALSEITAIDQLHPSLFPALTVLAGLTPVESNDEQVTGLLKQFEEKILTFLGSPVYQLRHLSASSLVALTTTSTLMSQILWVIDRLISDFSALDFNLCHGYLLLTCKLLSNIHRREDVDQLWGLLLQRDTLLHLSVPCMVKAEYLKVMTCLLMKYPDLALTDTLLHTLNSMVCDHQGQLDVQQYVGYCLLSEEAVNLLLTSSKNCLSGQEWIGMMGGILRSHDIEARRACLCHLKETLSTSDLERSSNMLIELQSCLVASLKVESHIPNLVLILELVLLVHNKQGTSPADINNILHWLTANHDNISKYTSLAAAALPIRAICIEYSLSNKQSSIDLETLRSWCETVCCYSNISQNETRRTASATALLVAGQAVLKMTSGQQCHDHCSVRLISASLNLIQDDDTEIRSLAAMFVARLHWPHKNVKYYSIQSNVCYELLLNYVASEFWWSKDCVAYLWKQLYTPHTVCDIVADRKQTRYQQLFDQEDNSWYGERIDNAKCMFHTLKTILVSHPGCISDLIVSATPQITQDMSDLCLMLANIQPGSVINPLIDGSILGAVMGLLLQALLVLHHTTGESDLCNTALQKSLDCVLQNNSRLPVNLINSVIRCSSLKPCVLEV